MANLRKLLDSMNQIDENPLVGMAIGAAANALTDDLEEAWDEDKNHGLGNEHDDTDAPYNDHDADYEATLQGEDPHKDDWMMRGGEDGLGPDGDGRHDRHGEDFGEDPWGLGEDEAGHPLPHKDDGYEDNDCRTCGGMGVRTKAMFGPDAAPGCPDCNPGDMLQDDNRGENVPDDVQLNELPQAREKTNKLLAAAEEGYMDWESLASECLNWMSEHEVSQMYDQQFDWIDEEMGEGCNEEDDEISQSGYDRQHDDDFEDGEEHDGEGALAYLSDCDDGLGDDPWGIGDSAKDGTAVERVQDRVAQRYGDETTEASAPPVATSGVRG